MSNKKSCETHDRLLDALKMFVELRMSPVCSLMNPKEFSNEANQVEMRSS